MKYYLYLIILLFFSGCGSKNGNINNSEKANTTEALTEFEFNKEIHNFGALKSGEIVLYNFKLKNTGDNDLVIYNISTDCGCITANFNKNPVPPGKEGVIEIEFDSSGLFGHQYKSITVETNAKEKIKHLAIVTEVENELIEINY